MARRAVELKQGKAAVEDRDRHFVREFFTNGYNASKAYEAAGFKDGHHNAYKLMKHPRIAPLLEEYRERLEKKYEITSEKIRNEYGKIAFGGGLGQIIVVNDDGTAEMDFNLLTQAARDCLQEFSTEKTIRHEHPEAEGEEPIRVETIKTKVKFPSKQAALDSLARIEGLFKKDEEKTSGDEIVNRITQGRNRVSGNGNQGA